MKFNTFMVHKFPVNGAETNKWTERNKVIINLLLSQLFKNSKNGSNAVPSMYLKLMVIFCLNLNDFILRIQTDITAGYFI